MYFFYFAATLPNVGRFPKFSHFRLSSKFGINWILKIPQRPKRVATIPCELLMMLNPVYRIQPVVKPVVKPVWQPVKCLNTRYNRLSTRLSNRLSNPLCLTTGCVLYANIQPVVSCKRGINKRLCETHFVVNNKSQSSAKTRWRCGRRFTNVQVYF